MLSVTVNRCGALGVRTRSAVRGCRLCLIACNLRHCDEEAVGYRGLRRGRGNLRSPAVQPRDSHPANPWRIPCS
jgi:hypothetical protein